MHLLLQVDSENCSKKSGETRTVAAGHLKQTLFVKFSVQICMLFVKI